MASPSLSASLPDRHWKPTWLPLLLLLVATHACAGLRLVDFPPRVIKTYRSYSDVTLLHVKIPEHAVTATWNLTAWEVKQSIVSLSSCKPRALTAYVKAGGYPVISPDGSTFPADFFERDADAMWNVTFASDAASRQLVVDLPAPGDWFAAVFADYTDPDLDGIGQAGLTLVCLAILQADVHATLANHVHELAERQPISARLGLATPSTHAKLFAPSQLALVRVRLVTQATPLAGIRLAVTRPNGKTDASLERRCLPADADVCEVSFAPSDATWYFVTASLNDADADDALANVTLSVVFERGARIGPLAVSREPLTRYSYGSLFSFGFERTASLGNASALAQSQSHSLLLRPGTASAMQFAVHSVQDIGGTLAVALKISPDSLPVDFTAKHVVMVTGCLAHERPSLPSSAATCADAVAGDREVRAPLRTNSSGALANAQVQVAFPEAGTWHLIVAAFCTSLGDTETPVDCAAAGLDAVNVSFVLESATCERQQCGPYGQCFTAVSGALVYAACNCFLGYRGWACTDASQVTSDSALLAEVLLLTLSNLFFVPAVVVSVRWAYYTEALVYACAMLFSTFYHACDAGGDVFSFCLLRGSVLQFCDFFAAVLAVWVTLVAMAALPPAPRSLAQMAGAVGIALGAEVNRTALWMFLAPTLLGLALVATSWTLRMRRQRACYPSGRYWKLHLPVGLALIAVGLVAYAFLETARNYKYVHSVWHAVMALSIVVVLPSNRRDRAAVIPAGGDAEAEGAVPPAGGPKAGRRLASLWTDKHEKCRALKWCCLDNDQA